MNLFNVLILSSALLCTFSFISVQASDVVLIQSGKTFVKGITEAKAKEIAENRDEIKKYSFSELKIKAGDTVEFVNSDSVKHNVFLEDIFNFVQPPGSKDKQQFKKSGHYNVRCAIHPKMKIKITVD